eukprot:TRINITY_DN4561_c0_g1_i4.p1 TRINITY_DN4561_c0_g1~~TRINITY_DN4561_c0_g1_i4.p1  ORF type:complete len:1889 (+),score=471.83 TRINITY_DN4561_c0_g1_i4:256-5922(+)
MTGADPEMQAVDGSAELLRVRTAGIDATSNVCLHFRLAVGKTILLKRRKPQSFFCELLLPAVFVGLLLIGHFLSDTTDHNDANFGNRGFFNITEEISQAVCVAPPDPLSVIVPPPNPLGLTACEPLLGHFCREGFLGFNISRTSSGGVICINSAAQSNISNLVHLVSGSGRPSDLLTFDAMVVTQKIAEYVLSALKLNYGSVQNSLLHSGALLVALDMERTMVGSCEILDAVLRRLNSTTMLFNTVLRPPPPEHVSVCSPLIWESEKAAADAAHRSNRELPTWAVLVVRDILPRPVPKLGMTVRMNYTATPFTRNQKKDRGRMYSHEYMKYLTSGFLTLQTEFFQKFAEIIESRGEEPVELQQLSELPFPVIHHTSSEFLERAGGIIPLVLALAFIYPVSRIVSGVVEEKELRLREGMLIMGLSKAAFYGSWLCVAFCTISLTSLIMSLMMGLTFLSDTSFVLLFLLVWEYGLSMVSLGMLTTVFFSRARIAAVAGPLAVVLFVIPQFAVPQGLALSAQKGMSLISPTPFAIAFTQMTTYEMDGEGATLKNLNSDEYSFRFALFMLLLDAILYLVLFFYLDAVLPSEYGTRRHPLWFCFPSFWRSTAGVDAGKGEPELMDEGPTIERSKDDAAVRVRVSNLRKEFKGDSGLVVAVDRLNLEFREGRIQVVLGHNGAGKTTLFNMLTGLLPPSSGDCRVWGTSIKDDIGSVRRDLGLCPQHNILWPTLTCMEHLRFFGQLKGLTRERVDMLAEQLLHLVGLFEKRSSASSTLSGGQKRKLSVAIALIGGARLVFFDEPTAGMDVGARRNLWTLLKRPEILVGRVVVLTTHYMDEADLLGDSIAIMQTGKLHSCGSSFFLKSVLGVGYHLTATAHAGGSAREVPGIVRKHLGKSADVASETSTDVKISLSRECSSAFPDLFSELDRCSVDQGFDYGVGLTTLEEIFMRIAEERSTDRAASIAGALERGTPQMEEKEPSPTGGTEPVWELSEGSRSVGRTLLTQQLVALLIKRFNYGKRDRRTLFFQFVLPILFIAFALVLKQINPASQPLKRLDEAYFDDPSEIPYGPSDNDLMESCGARCQLFDPLFRTINVSDVVGAQVEHSGNLSAWLLREYDSHKDIERIMAYQAPDSFRSALHNHSYDNRTVYSAGTLLHNTSAHHALPAAISVLQTAALRNSSGVAAAHVSTFNHPLPFSDYEQQLFDQVKVIITGVFVMIPFSLLPSNFVSFVVRERHDQVKHLQLVSGLHVGAYWASNFVFDILSYTISVGIALVIFAADGRGEFTGRDTIGPTVVLFMLFGCASITTSYFISFVFTSHTSAQNAVMAANVVCGFLLVIAGQLLDLFDETKDANRVLKYFYRLVPSYCLGEGIILLSILPVQHIANDAFGFSVVGASGWSWDVTGRNDVYLACIAPAAMLIVLVIDTVTVRPLIMRTYYSLKKRFVGSEDEERQDLLRVDDEAGEDEDDDVARERQEIESGSRDGDAVVVRGMRKTYPNGTKAVKGVTFGVKAGEVFAFLGANGAGKSTTISALTGEVIPTEGTITVAGVDVSADPAAARRGVGLCPQFDALLDLLTVDETLELFARLRGLHSTAAAKEREGLIRALGLGPFRKTVAKALSGGNRRKLSLAVALTGAPKLALLDEPSAGMDPQARRELWKVVAAAARLQGRSVVLTTHHLEEVEALSSGLHRVAIMARGELRCVAPLQRLKSRFGGGYELSLQAADPGRAARAVMRWVASAFPSAVQTERTAARLSYRLPARGGDHKGKGAAAEGSAWKGGTVLLGDAFRTLADCPLLRSGELTHYALSQLSLEQVFLRVSSDADKEAGFGESTASPSLLSQTASPEPGVSGVVDAMSLDDGDSRTAGQMQDVSEGHVASPDGLPRAHSHAF